MHFPDLSLYSYYQPQSFADVLNVGWIGRGQAFPVGKASHDFLDKLKLLIREGSHFEVNRMRSVHPCNVCGERDFATLNSRAGIPVGAAEIWVPRVGGGFFASPSMILHYVMDHNYLPPDSFIDSVLAIKIEQLIDAQSEYTKRSALVMEKAT